MLRIVTNSLKMRAGWETGLPRVVVPRPRQILEVCELLDGADGHTGLRKEEGRTVGFLS